MPRRPPQIKTRAFLANLPMFCEMGEVELDRNGKKVDVGTTPALYLPGEAIRFGASVGARPF